LTNPQEKVSLTKIARFLGLGGKEEGLSGAEVWPAYQRGEHGRIQRYCECDVRLVREVYRAMMAGR
jgi:predicted PolB exonuclease-like 3'-5' exonuclease